MPRIVNTRRTFLAGMGLAATAVTGIAACIQGPETPRTGSALPPQKSAPVPAAPVQAAAAVAPAPAAQTTPMDHAQMMAQPAAATNPAVSGLTKADEMDAHHQAGVKLFPARTMVHGNQPLRFELDGDVKVFKLATSRVKWEV